MQPLALIQAITILLSVLTAALAWGAKLLWSKEFALAKNEVIAAKVAQLDAKDTIIQAKDALNSATHEIIKSKDAHIQALEREIKSLQDLTPMKIREYFVSVKEQLEEYNNELKSKLEAASEEIEKKSAAIKALESDGSHKQNELVKLREERDRLIEQTQTMKSQLPDAKLPIYLEQLADIKIPQFDALKDIPKINWAKIIENFSMPDFTKFNTTMKSFDLILDPEAPKIFPAKNEKNSDVP